MSFPPLQPISDFHSYVSGDVTIDPSAAIAPGVLLQADPDSRIAIAAGACIGMGSVLHANQGSLIVEKGATLGAGILVVGRVKIGANACIGSVTTILNCDVEGGTVVSPGSLLGDESPQLSSESVEVQQVKVYSSATQASINSAVARNAIANPAISRSVEIQKETTSINATSTVVTGKEEISDPQVIPEAAVRDKAGSYSAATQASINSAVARNAIANISGSRINVSTEGTPATEAPESAPKSNEATPEEQTSESKDAKRAVVYGQQHLERLMGTLFPYQSRNPQNGQSPQ